ncbi:MAG: hypothetical protein ACO1QR_11180 [Chthoniobacteraceae bacterium]
MRNLLRLLKPRQFRRPETHDKMLCLYLAQLNGKPMVMARNRSVLR